MCTHHDNIAQQLKAAIQAGDEAGKDRIRELLSRHVAVSDSILRSALYQAARSDRVEACRLLWKRLSPRGRQKYFASKASSHKCPLHEAVENGRFEVVRLFIEEFHFNINQTDIVGDTPLCYARYSEAMSRYLLEKGAHVNRGGTMEGYGSPAFGPLWFAVNGDDRNIVRLLLQHGADPNFNQRKPANEHNQGNARNTDNAIQNGNAEILSMLIQHGAFVGNYYCRRDGTNRYTSLNLLLRYQGKSFEVKLSICRILVEHAERDHATAAFMRTTFEVAIEEAEIEHCALLLDVGLNRISAMYWAIQAGNEAVCRMLVQQYQVNPFAQESNESHIGENEPHAAASSPFLAAARLQDTAILRFFLQLWDERYSAVSSGKNDNGEYPIHVLCRDKRLSLQALRLLMEDCDQAATLIIADAEEHFLPFVSAAVSDANLDIIYYLLHQCPDALNSSLRKQTSSDDDSDNDGKPRG